MKAMAKRLAAVEAAAAPAVGKHPIWCDSSWDRELVLDHYGRERIGPNDEVVFIGWKEQPDADPMPYPAGYFDEGGRWAALCASRGIPHRDDAK